MNEPPAAKGVTPSKVRYRPLASTRNPLGWKVIAFSLLGAVAAGVILVVVAGKSAEIELEARGKFDRTVTIEAGQSIQYVVLTLTSGVYEFDVSAHEGPLLMAFGTLEPGKGFTVKNSDLIRIIESAVPVEAGKRRRMDGRLNPGRYCWMVINASKDKAVDATIKFTS